MAVQLSSLSFPGYKALKGEGVVCLDPVVDLRPRSNQNALDKISRQILQRGLLREIPTGRKGRLHLVIKYTIGLHQVTQRLERIGVILGLGILLGCRVRCRRRRGCRRSRVRGGNAGLRRGRGSRRRHRGRGDRPGADVLRQGGEVQGQLIRQSQPVLCIPAGMVGGIEHPAAPWALNFFPLSSAATDRVL